MPNGGEQVILAHSSVDLSSAWVPLQTTSAIALVALTGTLSAHENHLLSCWFFTLLQKKTENNSNLPFQLVDTFYTGISFLKIHLMDVNDEYGQGHRCLRHLVRGRLLVRLWQRWWVEVPRGRFDRLSHSWLEVRTRLMSYCGDRIGRQTFAEPLNRDHQGL